MDSKEELSDLNNDSQAPSEEENESSSEGEKTPTDEDQEYVSDEQNEADQADVTEDVAQLTPSTEEEANSSEQPIALNQSNEDAAPSNDQEVYLSREDVLLNVEPSSDTFEDNSTLLNEVFATSEEVNEQDTLLNINESFLHEDEIQPDKEEVETPEAEVEGKVTTEKKVQIITPSILKDEEEKLSLEKQTKPSAEEVIPSFKNISLEDLTVAKQREYVAKEKIYLPLKNIIVLSQQEIPLSKQAPSNENDEKEALADIPPADTKDSTKKKKGKGKGKEKKQKIDSDGIFLGENKEEALDADGEPIMIMKRHKKIKFWVTKDIAEDLGREEILRATLRDAFIFIIFLIILTVFALGDRTSTKYLLNKAIRDQFIKKTFSTVHSSFIHFMEIKEISDVYFYMETLFLLSLHWDAYYEQYQELSQEDNKILFSNVLMGVPRIRQVRMSSSSCKISEHFTDRFDSCYGDYSLRDEDTAPFGLKEPTAWVYSPASKTHSIFTWGNIGSYGGGGYYYDFPVTKNETYMGLVNLRNNQWINRGTKALMIDFSLYNANINLFAICKLIFEAPSSGGIMTSTHIQIAQLIKFMETTDIAYFACECVFYVFIVFYTVEEIREIIYYKVHYLKMIWNYIDFIIILIGYFIAGCNCVKYIITPAALKAIRHHPEKYGNLEALGLLQNLLNYAVAIELFLVFIKIFKYININRSMCQLHNTLKRCAADMLAFSILFFTIFIAFALLGYLIFGREAPSYCSFGIAIFTLLRTILGDFNYSEIESVSRILAPIFFVLFMFLVFFVLLNMFLAIINDAYNDVKTELSLSVQEMQMIDYIKPGIVRCLKKLKLSRFLKLKEPEIDDFNITITKLRDALKKFDFTDMEIEMFFARYNIDSSSRIQRFDYEKLKQELENPPEPPMSPPKNEIGFVKYEDFKRQEERLMEIEEVANTLTTQIDKLINDMEETLKRINTGGGTE